MLYIYSNASRCTVVVYHEKAASSPVVIDCKAWWSLPGLIKQPGEESSASAGALDLCNPLAKAQPLDHFLPNAASWISVATRFLKLSCSQAPGWDKNTVHSLFRTRVGKLNGFLVFALTLKSAYFLKIFSKELRSTTGLVSVPSWIPMAIGHTAHWVASNSWLFPMLFSADSNKFSRWCDGLGNWH